MTSKTDYDRDRWQRPEIFQISSCKNLLSESESSIVIGIVVFESGDEKPCSGLIQSEIGRSVGRNAHTKIRYIYGCGADGEESQNSLVDS